MIPSAFLETYWRAEFKPQIFVAMSFDPIYNERFENVIKPAIEGIRINDVPLKAHRVDISKTGDSILTDIVDGIAHSEMVLADLSTVGVDGQSGVAYRNGNVMYEVGIALACRQPCEVLLVRSDSENFLFDVSTIPHMTLDFSNISQAISILRAQLISRLRERNTINDARVKIGIASLSNEEKVLMIDCYKYGLNQSFHQKNTGSIDFISMAALPRLLDKNFMVMDGLTSAGGPSYKWTKIGYSAATILNRLNRQLEHATGIAGGTASKGGDVKESSLP